MYAQSCRSLLFEAEGPVLIQGLKRLSELLELFPAATCCVVSTSYMLRSENYAGFMEAFDTRRFPTSSLQHGISLLAIDFLTDPSPGLMLGSCLVLGCCLSSFAHRRQDRDRFQTGVFIALALWAAALGRGIGASTNMITLGLVPWALCAAMLLSFAGHGLGRRLIERRRRQAAAGHAITTFKG